MLWMHRRRFGQNRPCRTCQKAFCHRRASVATSGTDGRYNESVPPNIAAEKYGRNQWLVGELHHRDGETPGQRTMSLHHLDRVCLL